MTDMRPQADASSRDSDDAVNRLKVETRKVRPISPEGSNPRTADQDNDKLLEPKNLTPKTDSCHTGAMEKGSDEEEERGIGRSTGEAGQYGEARGRSADMAVRRTKLKHAYGDVASNTPSPPMDAMQALANKISGLHGPLIDELQELLKEHAGASFRSNEELEAFRVLANQVLDRLGVRLEDPDGEPARWGLSANPSGQRYLQFSRGSVRRGAKAKPCQLPPDVKIFE